MVSGDISSTNSVVFPTSRICFFVQVNAELSLKTLSSLQQDFLFLYTLLFSTFSLRKNIFSSNLLDHFIF